MSELIKHPIAMPVPCLSPEAAAALRVFLASDRDASEWHDVIETLINARWLTADWDGDGAEAPGPDVADLALKIALELKNAGCAPPDFFGAEVDGGVSMSWRNATHSAKVEVAPGPAVDGHIWERATKQSERFAVLKTP